MSCRSQLEKVNGDLKDQLASLRSLGRSNDQLERSKRQLEEEVLDLRRRMEASQMEQSQVEQYRRDAEERVRQEIQQKLEQVNLFLQVSILLGEFYWLMWTKLKRQTKTRNEIRIIYWISLLVCTR